MTPRNRIYGLPALGGIENPHEVLGLAADEVNPFTIIEAAHARLVSLRSSGGSEVVVQRAVMRQIRAARAAMLAAAGKALRPRHLPASLPNPVGAVCRGDGLAPATRNVLPR